MSDGRLAALTSLFLALLAPAAHAATASVEGDTLRVTAAPGETNALSVRLAPVPALPGVVHAADAGAPLSPGAGCRPVIGGLECAGVVHLQADLGDGDDGATLDELALATVSVAGGEGDDTLIGSPGVDTLDGGNGRDSADGGPDADAIVLGDRLPDSAVCGSGHDTVRAEVLDQLDVGCERVDYGPPGDVGRLRPVRGGGRFVTIPGMPWARLDRRLLPGLLYLVRRYRVRVGDGYARTGHKPRGEHPLGLAVDLYPGPGGSWSDLDRLARWAEPRQDHPRPPFRWVGYNGDANHGDPRHCRPWRGCAPHLHLSWAHSPGRPGHPVRTVWTFAVRGARPGGPL
jgi:hypothetical protein